MKVENEDQRTGINIIKHAILAPTKTIACNAGEDGAVVVSKILENKDINYGYNASTGEYVDMMKSGIIDPTKVVVTALQAAKSIAGLFLTTECIIAEDPEDKKEPSMPNPGMGGMY